MKNENIKMIVAIAGSMETFMSIVSDLENRSIKTELISFVLLPFGSGNEIRSLFGWGHDAHSHY